MHKPLFRIAVGGVAAVGGLIAASALPAGAATAVLAADTPPVCTATTPVNSSATANNGGDCANTTVTFSVTSTGTLAITAPTSTKDLGNTVAGNVGSNIGAVGDFGAVTVTDNRGLDPATWTATVSSTDFANTSTGTIADTIPASDATYTIPAVGAGTAGAIVLSGALLTTGTLVDNTILVGTGDTATGGPVALSATAAPVVTVTGVDGDNGATWNPGIIVAVPAGAVVGTYTGVVTHSVT